MNLLYGKDLQTQFYSGFSWIFVGLENCTSFVKLTGEGSSSYLLSPPRGFFGIHVSVTVAQAQIPHEFNPEQDTFFICLFTEFDNSQ